MAERADAYRRSGEREGYPFKVHVRDGFGDGDTLEIGTRGSEVYLRLYDKHREGFKKTHSKQVQPGQFVPGSWRYEAELKGGAATELYCRLFEAPDGPEGHSQGVLMEVRGLFMDRGLDLPVGDVTADKIREKRYRSDLDRTRAWLRSAVRPTIKQLIADGYLAEVFSDLGLHELACVDVSQLLLTRPVEK
jgi:DNA relaxase NicK